MIVRHQHLAEAVVEVVVAEAVVETAVCKRGNDKGRFRLLLMKAQNFH
jgi:hypothetical protein